MFTALVDNELVNLDPRIPDPIQGDDKRALHRGNPKVRCRGCSQPAHIRQLEDRDDPFMIFAHNPGYAEHCKALGYHTDESAEHHDLKSRLAAAARKAGWRTDYEVYAEGCRADVVATHPTNNRCRVLEAQISPLNARDANDRTERYIDRFGGRVTWTHRGHRSWANRSPDVEALRVDDEKLHAVIAGVAIDQAGTKAPPAPIDTVIPRILNRQLRYIFFDTIGFYLDLAASVGGDGRRPHRQQALSRRGTHVEECSRPGDPVPIQPSAGRPICAACGRPFTWLDLESPPPPTCGQIPCRQVHHWTDDDWAGAIRMATARIDAGITLSDLDLQALARQAEADDVLLG